MTAVEKAFRIPYEPPQVRDGYVVMMDILGWKGIWRDHTIPKIQEVINRIRLSTHVHTASTHNYPIMGLGMQSIFLSDTLVIGLWDRPQYGPAGSSHGMHNVRTRLWGVVANIIKDCASSSPGLAFRGAISAGEFLFDENLLLGPAVDAAGSLMNAADGAFVWMPPPPEPDPEKSPHALHYSEFTHNFLEYDIPLCAGGTVRGFALNPFVGAPTKPEMEPIHRGILRTFDRGVTDPRVLRKKQNTEAFLDAVRDRQLAAWVGDETVP